MTEPPSRLWIRASRWIFTSWSGDSRPWRARIQSSGEIDEVFEVADIFLARRTTDSAYDYLADWMLFTQGAL